MWEFQKDKTADPLGQWKKLRSEGKIKALKRDEAPQGGIPLPMASFGIKVACRVVTCHSRVTSWRVMSRNVWFHGELRHHKVRLLASVRALTAARRLRASSFSSSPWSSSSERLLPSAVRFRRSFVAFFCAVPSFLPPSVPPRLRAPLSSALPLLFPSGIRRGRPV